MFSGISKALGVTKVTDEQHDADMKKQKKGPYSLPPEENDDPKAVYVEDCNRKYRIATIADFRRFRDLCNDSEGWTEKFDSPVCKVFDKPPEKGKPGETLNLIKVVNMFPRTSPMTLYNALHDNHYRKSWDTNMIEGFNICQLDPRNDIGYYSAQSPWPLHNREFINMRSWMEFDNGEFCIINRTVLHDDYPLTQKFVRGVSYFSGYYICPLGGEADAPGCKMIFYAHSDLQGAVPHSLINMLYTKMCPSLMTKLEENSAKYLDWVKNEAKRDENEIPDWRTAVVSWEAGKNLKPCEVVLGGVKELLKKNNDGGDVAYENNESLKDLKKDEVKANLEKLKKSILNVVTTATAAADGDNSNNNSLKQMIHDVVEYKRRRNKALKQKPASTKEFLESLVPVLEGIRKCCAME